MIELLVIVGLASIGIAFTSSLEAEEGRGRRGARRSGEAEGGLGIFGLDLARKKNRRKSVDPIGRGTAVRPFEETVEDAEVEAIQRRINATLAAEGVDIDDESYRPEPTYVIEPDPALEGVAIIDDFDPEEDRIVVGYDPEAGACQIHFEEDPNRLGDVRVLVNRQIVAVVPDGLGRVSLRHIELVPFSDMDLDSAA